MASPRVPTVTVSDLFKSATYGDVPALTEAVKKGVPIGSLTVGGSSVLHFAAYGGHAKMVSHLLKNYPECREIGHGLDMQGYNALHNCCAFSGDIGIFQDLLRAGFDINTRTSDGLTAVELAEKFEKNNLVEYIRYLQSEDSIVFRKGETNLLEEKTEEEGLSCMGDPDDSERTITSSEIDPADDVEWRRYTITDLLSSAEKGDIDLLDRIVHSGVAIDTTTKRGSSVLHFAASNGQTQMINHLIRKYPNCLGKGEHFDPNGFTALHHAVRLGRIDICEALLQAGFEREKTTADGRSILDLAMEAKRIPMIEYLEIENPSFIVVDPVLCRDKDSMKDSGIGSSLPTPPTSLITDKTDTDDIRTDSLDVVPSAIDDTTKDPRDVVPSAIDDTTNESRDVVPSAIDDTTNESRDVVPSDVIPFVRNGMSRGPGDEVPFVIDDLKIDSREDVRGDSRGEIPNDTPEDIFKKWIGLHRSAAEGNRLDVMNMIENGADAMKKINSVFFPNILLTNKDMLTPMEVALYSRQHEMVGLLVRYTEEEIVRKCLSKCEGSYFEMKPYVVKGILMKKYKSKYIDIVVGELLPEKTKVFVIYTKYIIHGSETTESGYRVLFRDPTVSSDEGRKVLRHSHENDYVLSDSDRKLVAKAIKQNGDKLWNNHSNLRGIMSSPVKSVGGSLEKKTCLVLLCHFKGFVPDNEPLFPREIHLDNDVLPVDVREGQVALHHVMCPDALHTPLSFGCNIGTADDFTTRFGTVGPFVKLNNGKVGFITCAHVVYSTCRFVGDSLPEITVLQPSNNDTTYPEEERICGKVVSMKYSLNEDTSIDVAVVEITVPKRMPSSPGLAAFSHEELTGRGISKNQPVFNHGEYGVPEVGREVVKFGSASGVTYGTYRGIETSEFSSKLYGRASETERWRGVYYIENRQCKEKDCKLPPFSTPGDSGAGVFQVKDDNSLICVGILVGADTATGSGIVIPIKPILEEFGLTLKAFQE